MAADLLAGTPLACRGFKPAFLARMRYSGSHVRVQHGSADCSPAAPGMRCYTPKECTTWCWMLSSVDSTRESSRQSSSTPRSRSVSSDNPLVGSSSPSSTLIIVALLAFAVTALTEWRTGQKLGKLFTGMVVTIVGALLVIMFVRLPAPLDFAIEDVPIVAALIGAIIVGVFYVLLRARHRAAARGRPSTPERFS
jgi:hypothetical protein